MSFTGKTQKSIHLIFFIVLLHFVPVFPQTNNSRIDQGQVLRDGETIVSPTQVFELGFFSLSNSNLKYFGIWYYGFQNRTVAWIANRNNPISGDSGVFSIGADGNLIVSDRNDRVYWSSNSSSDSVGSNLTAMLMDNGNLMLSTVQNVGIDTEAIWRSCDHPTDTYLPNQRIYLNITNGDSRNFVSWRSPNDPSEGNYSMGIDPRGSPQVVVQDDQSHRRLWRSGHWNNQIFIGIPQMRSLFLYGFNLVNVNDEIMYFIFNNQNTTLLMRFMIQWNGVVQQLTWDSPTSRWVVMLSQPTSPCEQYNRCGTFGLCHPSNSPSLCTCMEGFDRNSSGGCVRRTQLNCNSNGSTSDGFFQQTGVKLPDTAGRLGVSSSGDCEDGCLSNCSCNAYAYVSGIGCLIWGGNLVDMEQFEQGGETLFLRLADSDLESSKKASKTLVIALSVTGAVILGVIAFCLWMYRRKLKGCRDTKTKNHSSVSEATNGQENQVDNSGQQDLEGKPYEGPSLPLYSSSALEAATDGYANKNKLGQGGFGPVHKGILPGGQEIAVKRLSRSSGQGLVEFQNEMILIAKLQHRNLVRLLGYCIEGEERMLVYEYMPNKSLDTFLFDSSKKALWVQVIKSIHGADGGLTTSDRQNMHSCGWKNILESLSYFDKFSLNPLDCMQVEIGDGNGTKFWFDKWTEKGALKDSYPRCFALELNKDCMVRERRDAAVEQWPRRRPIRDGRERNEEIDLRNFLQSQRNLEDRRDRWIFNGAPNGVLYSAWIRDRIEQCRSLGNIFKSEWLNWIPIKDNILIWRIIKGRMAVRQTLAEMDIDVPSINCEICGDQEEDISHLFFKCDLAVWLWSRLGLWVKSSIPSFDSILDCFAWVDKTFQAPSKVKIVKAIVVALIKSIWIHRNDIIFNNNRVEKEICLRRMQEFSFFWLYNRSSLNIPDLNTWMSNPFCNS